MVTGELAIPGQWLLSAQRYTHWWTNDKANANHSVENSPVRRNVRAANRPAPAKALQARLMKFIERQPGARVDYIAFFDPETLEPAIRVTRGIHMALAVFVGKTRLIDNARL